MSDNINIIIEQQQENINIVVDGGATAKKVTFSNALSVEVAHNWFTFPVVQVYDDAGAEIPDADYTIESNSGVSAEVTTTTITFTEGKSGTVVLTYGSSDHFTNLAAGYATEAKGYRDEAEGFAGDANDYSVSSGNSAQTSVYGAQTATEQAGIATTAKNDAITAKNLAEQAVIDCQDIINSIGGSLSDYVTLATQQTITGQKKFDEAIIVKNEKGVDVELTEATASLNIGTSNADIINIGWSGATINFQGTLINQNVTNIETKDKLIRLNVGGSVASGVSSGFEIEENSLITGWFTTNGNRDGWEFKAPANAFTANLYQGNLTANRIYTLPNKAGTFAMTDDVPTGMVTGPDSAVGGNFASFNLTTGKIIKDSGYSASSFYGSDNPSSFISRSGISGTSPIGYDNSTGVISIQVASASQNGYLSSSDWSTFNGKQATGLSWLLGGNTIGAKKLLGSSDAYDIGLITSGVERITVTKDGNTTVSATLFKFTQPTTGVGTVSNSAGGTTVTGVGTQFTNTFKVGDTITIGGQTVSISAIASDTSMTTAAITNANSGVAYTLVGGDRFMVKGNGNIGNLTTPIYPFHFSQGDYTTSPIGGSKVTSAATAYGKTAFFGGIDPSTSHYGIAIGTNSTGYGFIQGMTGNAASLVSYINPYGGRTVIGGSGISDSNTYIANNLLVGAIGGIVPTHAISLYGTSAKTIWMERNTTAATAGQGLTLSSGGAIAGTADLAGGDLLLKSGISTGTGTSAIRFFTATAGSTGASDNSPTEKMTLLGNGNLGLGTNNPISFYHIIAPSTTFNVATFENAGNAVQIHIRGTGNYGNIINEAGSFYLDNSGRNISLRCGTINLNATKVSVGSQTPLSSLHLPAGTATANTAPLQFDTGVVETVPRNGVMEYDGTSLFFTPSGATRKTITYKEDRTVLPYSEKSATYAILATDYTINCTANSFTVTLPTAASKTGQIFYIKNSGTGTITIDTTSSQTIDDALTVTLSQWEGVKLQSTGANWIII